ncbi:MAG: hypothetical protein AAF548_09235 [Actinomycetota bacterium]
MPELDPMTHFSDAVRHAAALVHSVDGAEMRLRDGHGRQLSVGRHPSADVDPCRWHRFVSADHPHPRTIAATVVEGIAGRLEDHGGGIFADRHDPSMRWFVSALCPGSTVAALREVDLGEIPDDAVTASVRPDPALGVTVVGVRVDAPCFQDRLGDLALAAMSECLVAELVAALPARDRQS